MSHIADSRAPNGIGILPLQDHDPTIPIGNEDMRAAILAVRLKGRQRGPGLLGHWVEDPETRGDLLCAMNWRRRSRPVNGWAFAWPTVTDASKSSGPGAPVATGKQPGGMIPLRDNPPTPDVRFDTLTYARPVAGNIQLWPVFPNGWYGIGLAATNAQQQVDYFMPTDPRLVAVNFAGNFECGSLVCDLDPKNNVDPLRMARLQSMMRVLKLPVGINMPVNANVIAWQLGATGQSDTRGGFMYDRGAVVGGAPPTPAPDVPTVEPGTGFPNQPDPVADKFKPPGAQNVVGMASRNDSGPVAVGSFVDKHRLARDADGNPINSAHIDVDAYYRRNDDEDGPFLYEGLYKPPDHQFDNFVDVHLEWDGKLTHPFIGGPRKGKWRWRAESPFYVPTGGKIPIPTKPPDELVPVGDFNFNTGTLPNPNDGPGTPTVDTGVIPGTTPTGETGAPNVPGSTTPLDNGFRPIEPGTPPISDEDLIDRIRHGQVIGATPLSETRTFLGCLWDVAVPALIFRPQNLATGALNVSQDVASVDKTKYDSSTPVTMNVAAYGAEGGCFDCGDASPGGGGA